MTTSPPPIGNHEVLRLMAWLSPSFPVGAFSYSHGVEYAVEAELIDDRESLENWIKHLLQLGGAYSDGILLRAAYAAASEDDVNRFSDVMTWADVFRATPEMALESSAQGGAFVKTVADAWPEFDLQPWQSVLDALDRPATYAPAIGLVAALAHIPLNTALAAFLHSFTVNLVSAGIRLIPLGQTDGQKATANLETTILNVTDEIMAKDQILLPDDLGAAAPMADWASMQHETQYTRLFRS